jgi:hypothetical protein
VDRKQYTVLTWKLDRRPIIKPLCAFVTINKHNAASKTSAPPLGMT